MMKYFLLCGIVGLGALIGVVGVSRVRQRLDALQMMKHDMKKLEHLLVRRSMPLGDAFIGISKGSSFSEAYQRIAKALSDAGKTAEKAVDGSGMSEELLRAEFTEDDILLLREHIVRLSESMSLEEISIASERFSMDLDRVISELGQNGLSRAKVLRTVWMLAGLGTAIILI